ncbi:hypothetical protein [Priestia koreensis]|uniref:hypothetical protein n=1 Tax=Priestia koreensis TaxID=284581 RepID=UPI003458891A
MWAISVQSSLSKSLTRLLSDHFSIFVEYDNSEHEYYFFTSSHLDDIKPADYTIASYRSKALIRILNSILSLTGSNGLAYDSDIIHYISDNDVWLTHTINVADQDIEYRELQYPFNRDPHILNEFESVPDDSEFKRHYIIDFFDCAYKEEIVHEVLILFSVLKYDVLLILVNTSKILENIEYDLGIGKGTKNPEEKINELKSLLTEDFWNSYFFFKKGRFTHFSNTNLGSKLFSRHGLVLNWHYTDKKGDPLPPVSFKDIHHHIPILISEWISYKIYCKKAIRYKAIPKIKFNELLTDEDFEFDL